MSNSLTIVCHSITDWDAPMVVSRQQIMKRLAERHRVLFIESPRGLHSLVTDRKKSLLQWRRWAFSGLREGPGNMLIASPPPVLPFFYHRITNAVNQRILRAYARRIVRRLGWKPDVNWTYWPNSAYQVGAFGERCSVYHCTDNIIVARYPFTTTDIISSMERELTRRVDLAITRTEGMALERLRRDNPHTHVIQGGVDLDMFDPERDYPQPDALADIPRPRAGMIATLDDRLDTDMILATARALPDVHFVFIGHVRSHLIDTAPLLQQPNVHLLPAIPHEHVPACTAQFDVAFIPYRVNEYTREVAPIKLYECLAMARPIVATRLPYIEREAGVVTLVDTIEEAVDAVGSASEHTLSGVEKATLRSAATPWTWEKQVAEIEELLLETVKRTRDEE